MSYERLVAAISRIEQALARVEAVAARPAEAENNRSQALFALEARHTALKSEAQAAIAELDSLISAARGGS